MLPAMTADADGSNKRKHPRVRIPLLVQYRTSPLEPFHTDYASDISEGGIYLTAHHPVATGTTLFLQFVTRDGMHLISAEAKVVHARPDGGQGMQFVKLDQADHQALQALIDRVLKAKGGI
jgi:uncharacterized protein (TIGR02266 family)